MFSIIIPLYNKATYIEKAIQSVFDQTYFEYELIIINDGSTDRSLEVVTNFINSHNFPSKFGNWNVINQKNAGVSSARNNGVKAAKNKYIAFLDADDWWEPDYLKEMKKLIENFPTAGVYGSSYYKVKKGQNIIANVGVEPAFINGLINYCQVYAKSLYQPICTSAAIIKKKIFENEHGFTLTLKLGEDFDLWLRVSMKYPVAFLNKPLAYYNQDVDQANRAIGSKLYEPNEHMLFTDYGNLMYNTDFRILYEVLAVYGLLPYYLFRKNKKEVDRILSGIHWKNHAFKYRLQYRILPKLLVRSWLKIKMYGSNVKTYLIAVRNSKFINI